MPFLICSSLILVSGKPSLRCWWCGSGERQTRFHIFARCRRWGPEIVKRLERDCELGGPRALSVRRLFGDVRATPAVPEFLEDTRVDRIPGRVFLAGGAGVKENELEEIEMWAPEEEGAGKSSISEEEDGLGPPP